jgi:hypothetical protein
MHAELAGLLNLPPELHWRSPAGHSAVAYRSHATDNGSVLPLLPEVLVIGRPLPTLPMWLGEDGVVPVNPESAYLATCQLLRISA